MLTEEQKRKRREEYAWYKEHHICVNCHQKDAFGKLTMCPECLEKKLLIGTKWDEEHKERRAEARHKAVAARNAKRMALGLCVSCKSPICKARSTRYCERCLNRKNILRAEKRKQNLKGVQEETRAKLREAGKKAYEKSKLHPNWIANQKRMKEREHQRILALRTKKEVAGNG